jgi:hypothetical protein
VLQRGEPLRAVEVVAVDAAHLVPHGGARLAHEFLGLVRDTHAALPQQLAGDRVVLAGEELEQRRLPRAVAPDDADLLAAFDGERHVVEQHRPAEVHRDVGEGEQRHRTRGA